MSLSRRDVLLAGASLAGGMLLGNPGGESMAAAATDPMIDRKQLADRHSPVVTKVDPYSALTIGNGSLAFTADVTGLQSFPEGYEQDFPLCTCAHWGWHTTPIPQGLSPGDFRYKPFDVHGRSVGYATDAKGQEELFNWLRQNPHRLHLGRLGLLLKKPDGSAAAVTDLSAIFQRLELWSGQITSRFTIGDSQVIVQTCCHPDTDALAVRIESDLVTTGALMVFLAFPYPSPNVDMADWNSAAKHQTKFIPDDHRAEFQRTIDKDSYFATLGWNDGKLKQIGDHEFHLQGNGRILEFVLRFSPTNNADPLPTVAETFNSSAAHWKEFWSTGGAIDLSKSTDPRANELERRIVLSQYNTALHCAGPMPPQETGLLFNSWYGKSHLEMHWWHGVHFALWGRFPLLARSLDFYHRIMPVAKATADRQGYAGVRWPKMVGPDGQDAPSPVGPLLIWQQAHPIYYAELCYRNDPKSLQQCSDIVFSTADFMASYAFLENNRYSLGPPMKTVSENADTHTTTNPTFELTYWRMGLSIAQQWRQRMGLPPDPKWADILNRLALPAQADGLYLMQEGMTDTYTKWNWEHPALIGGLGMLNGTGIDPETMRRTLKKVLQVWDFDKCWGWDFPMMAMTAARLGEGELAVQALLIDSPKNRYHPNGHVYQRPGLTAYLPANGGLLAAAAMMALSAEGFPKDGKWRVRSEGLSALL